MNHSDSPDPGPAGGIFTYTLRVDNNGPNGAVGVTLDDTLPPGSTFVGVTTTAGSCSGPVGAPAPGTISCALGNIAASTNETVTIQVRLPTAAVWRNTATAGSGTNDPNTGNNLNSIQDTTATQAADLVLTATPSLANVTAGQAYSYALQASNSGPDAATGSQSITFAVPAGSSITAAPTGSGWGCTPTSGYPLSTGTITCTRTADLANGTSTALLTVPAVSNVNGTVTAAFAIAGKKADLTTMPDGNLTNNTVSVDVASASGSDVSVVKTRTNANVGQGETVVYTLTPRLNGGQLLTGQPITVTDTLGAGLTYVSAAGSGWICDATISCTRTGDSSANFTDLPAIIVTATATNTGTLSNTAVINVAGLTDPTTGNNTSTVTVNSSNDANLLMTKTASINPVVPNQAFNYTMTVRNTGPLAVPAGQTITITDSVPTGLTLNSASGSGWFCSTLPVTGPGVLTCTRAGALAANADAPALVASAVVTGASSVTNNACVALSGAGRVDSDATNNCSDVTVTASSTSADLRVVSKTASPATVVAGQNLTYVITVKNDGPDPSTNVIVSDAITDLINTGGFQSVLPSQGNCTPNSVTNGTSQNLSCNLGSLNSGAQATVTVVVRPNIATSGARLNVATVRSADIGDPDQSNNSGSVTSQVSAIVDVTAAKSATPNTVPAGAPITFVATIGNVVGPSTAQAVQMVDTLPSNAAFISLDSVNGGGTCNTIAPGTVGGTLTCNWSSIAAGAQNTVTYRMRPLGSAAGGTVVNSIAATTTTAESNSANNSATTSTPVTAAQLDILVNKVDSADPIGLGLPTTYTITVNNSGPSYGTNVVMTDIFPAPGSSPTATFSYQGALTVDSGGVCSEPAVGATSGTLSCVFPGLNSGQTAKVTYVMNSETITTAGAFSGTVFNQATVAVNETETTLANNVVTHDTTTNRVAIATDLALVKSAPAGPLAPGASLAYTLVVTNNGPLVSNGAQVVDVLPVGVNFVSAPGCVNTAGSVRCGIGSLAVSASRTFTITTTLSTPYTGARPLVNSATLDAPGDINPGNNTSNVTTVVSVPPGGATGIPTLSEWGLIILTMLMGLMAWRHSGVIGRR